MVVFHAFLYQVRHVIHQDNSSAAAALWFVDIDNDNPIPKANAATVLCHALPPQGLSRRLDKPVQGLGDHCDNAGVSTENWNKYRMGDWFIKWATKYRGDLGVLGWNWPTSLQNTLATEAGNFVNFDCTGIAECPILTDQQQCKQKPEHFFILSNIANFGHYLYGIIEAAKVAIPVAGLSAPDISKNFTNGNPKPPTGPQQGLAIVNGILGALSVVFPPAAVAAGAGGVVSGALGLAALDIPPVDLTWQAAEEYLATIAKQFIKVISDYAHYMLETIPGKEIAKMVDPPPGIYNYAQDPQGLPQIFAKGYYASRKDFGVLPQGFYASWTSSLINWLWNQKEQQVFIVKLNKDQFQMDVCTGDGKPAIKGAEPFTVCIDGNAHVFLQWTYKMDGRKIDTGSLIKSRKVPGIDKLDIDINGNIKLDSIVKSAAYSNQKVGFGKPMEAKAMIENLLSDPGNITPDKTISFNLPICDMTVGDVAARFKKKPKCMEPLAQVCHSPRRTSYDVIVTNTADSV
ncbi:MAG: hypothetical protein Q9160_002169 [Pyrenula sp. 1 TL-2023]